MAEGSWADGAFRSFPTVLMEFTGLDGSRMAKRVPTFHLIFGLETVNIDGVVRRDKFTLDGG